MLSRGRNRAAGRRLRGFTIIEMLVVVSIIMILAGIMLPSLRHAREEARIANCLSNLKQVGQALIMYANAFGEGGPEYFPPWVTLLLQTGGRKKFLEDPRVLVCPDDASQGAEGGRPDHMRYEGGNVIHQFEMADVDLHTGPRNGQGPKNAGDGGLNCSYIFEFSGEPCDWIYTSGPPVSSGTSSTTPKAPDTPEWLWDTSVPAWNTFKTMVDRDRNGVLSWSEIKMFSRKGCNETVGGTHYKIRPWGDRVPFVRCYWHVENQRILKDTSLVLNLLGDASAAVRGAPPWFKD